MSGLPSLCSGLGAVVKTWEGAGDTPRAERQVITSHLPRRAIPAGLRGRQAPDTEEALPVLEVGAMLVVVEVVVAGVFVLGVEGAEVDTQTLKCCCTVPLGPQNSQ